MKAQTAKIMSGHEAMALAYQLAGVEIAYTFPITPQSEVIQYLAQSGQVTCIQADSEYNVLAGAEGVLWAGERCAVVTSSQGLVLMSELMFEVAGNRLPLVMGVFNRALKGPGWSLGAQQNDSLFMRDTGWLQFYCESAQEILDFILLGTRLAEQINLPVLVVGDGFYVSHEQEEVWLPDPDEVRAFVGPKPTRHLPRSGERASFGGLVPAEKYHRFYRQMHHDVLHSATLFTEIAAAYGDRFGRHHSLAEPFNTEEAEIVFVTAGTISGTVREAVEQLRQEGKPVGLLKLHAFRPFPQEWLQQTLASGRKVVVLDRNIAPGQGGIFAAEVKMSLYQQRQWTPVYSFVTGLGGLDVTPEMIGYALEYVRSHDRPPPTLFLTEEGVT